MIAVLLITALFVFISIYFFLRAEKLQHKILLLKRETVKAQQENKILSKSMGLMASNTEDFAKSRLEILLKKKKDQETTNELALIKILIDNYSIIFKECLIKKGKLHSMTKKCFSAQGNDAYKEFFDKIIKRDSKIQRLWSSNNFIGFVCFVEALLIQYEGKLQNNAVVEESTTTTSN